MEHLAIWRTYLAAKVNHQMVTLLFTAKTSMSTYERKFLGSMKKSMGLVKSVNSDRLLTVANMLSPREQATKYLIRVTKKLLIAGTPKNEIRILLKTLEELQSPLYDSELEPYGEHDSADIPCQEYERRMKTNRVIRTGITLYDTLKERLKEDTFFKLFMGNYNWRGHAG